MLFLESHWPVVTSDACSTSACWLLTLLVVMSIHMGFGSFPLQDLPELIDPNASEKCSCLVRLLNHPLKNRNINYFMGHKMVHIIQNSAMDSVTKRMPCKQPQLLWIECHSVIAFMIIRLIFTITYNLLLHFREKKRI